MKNGIWILILVSLLAACKSPKKEIDVLSDGSKFKLIAFEDYSDSLKLDQYLMCYITIADTAGDTIHYVPDFPYFIEYYASSPLFPALNRLHLGDSFHLQTKESILFESFGFDPLKENSNDILELRIRAIDFIDSEEVKNTLMENLGKRLSEEEHLIAQYLSKQVDNAAYLHDQGIYIKSEIKTTNPPLSYGDKVTLEYQGQFLNGYVFDSKKGDKALEIVYGMSDQVISGIEQGIKGLSEGESVKIILPSQLAFGAEGSVKGIVPPYTPVAYNIFIKKVTHKN